MRKKNGCNLYNYLVKKLDSLTVNTKRAVKFPVIAIAQCQVKLGKEEKIIAEVMYGWHKTYFAKK